MTQSTEATDTVGLNRSFATSIFDSALTSVLLMALTFASGALLSRLLGPENRGAYGALFFWSQLFVGLLSVSTFEAAMVRIRSRSEERTASPLPLLILFSASFATMVAAIVAVASAAGAFDAFSLFMPEFPHLVVLLATLLLVSNAFTTNEIANLNFTRLNIERVATPSIFIILALALAILSIDDPGVAVLAYVCAMLPLLFYRLWRNRRTVVGPIDGTLFSQTVRLARRFYVEFVSGGLNREADRFIVVTVWSSERLGYYFVAFSAAGASMAIVEQSIRLVLLPSLVRVPDHIRRFKIEQLLRLTFLIGLGVIVGIWFIAPLVIPLVYGVDFEPAVGYLRGMIIPLALTPIISVIIAAARSMESTIVGIQMAWAGLVTLAIGFLTTQFAEPSYLFATMTVANLISIALGMRQLKRIGVISIRRSLIIKISDISVFWDHACKYSRNLTKFN